MITLIQHDLMSEEGHLTKNNVRYIRNNERNIAVEVQ